MLTAPGRMIILLCPPGPGKTQALLGGLGLGASSKLFDYMVPYWDGKIGVGLCTAPNLLESHLSGFENMVLKSALRGDVNLERIRDLLARSGIAEDERTRAYYLPLPVRQTFQFLLALLADPDVLLIDELTNGMSLPAKRKIWQFLLSEQSVRPRVIFYVTEDLESIQVLGDEVWLLVDGEVKAQWPISRIPSGLYSTAGFLLELKTKAAAQDYYEHVRYLEFVRSCIYRAPFAVEVYVSDFKEIVTLTWIAGMQLARFSTIPVTIDRLVTQLLASELPVQVASTSIASEIPQTDVQLPCSLQSHEQGLTRFSSLRRTAKAILSIAVSEWHRHFRSFWGYFNVVFTSLCLLIVLTVVFHSSHIRDFSRLAPLFLLTSAALNIGLGLESVGCLVGTGSMGTLFQPPRPPDAIHPLSLLSLYDLTGIARWKILAGLALGQILVLGVHSWPLLLYAWGAKTLLPQVSGLLIVIFCVWILMALATLGLTIRLGTWLRRPRWGIVIGWLAWGAVILSGYILPDSFPYFWIWPFKGFKVAIERLFDGASAVAPFIFALLGTVLLCVMAIRSFVVLPAVKMRGKQWER